jgi:signal transduction histidine kinase
MSQTINDFRDFLNPSKEKTEFSVYRAIEFSLHLMEESIKSNNISVNIELTKDARIYGYENEFSQVISNILNNARDALEEVNIKRMIQIGIDKIGDMAEVTIFNNGRPIEPKVMEKMFTPYFTTKAMEKGTGIGLYMSRVIIEEHLNGEISFQNAKDGVICRISVPVSNPMIGAQDEREKDL